MLSDDQFMKKPKLRLERGSSKIVPPPDDPDLPNAAEKSPPESERPPAPGAKERRPKTDKPAAKPADADDGVDDEALSAA